MQTNIRASLLWSEKENFEEYNESFIPGFPERLSFAAYQTVSGEVPPSSQPLISSESSSCRIDQTFTVHLYLENCESYI
jgi:hypothetical protein